MPTSRRLVIDASVAASAGPENAIHPTSKHCRDFLLAVRQHGHYVVIGRDLNAEWKRHQSGFAREWMTSMVARKRALRIDCPNDSDLRSKIAKTTSTLKDKRDAIKDCHLIEAALLTDKTIASLDETAKKLFVTAALMITDLKLIIWVNPRNETENCLVWLENQAKPERKRSLGSQSR